MYASHHCAKKLQKESESKLNLMAKLELWRIQCLIRTWNREFLPTNPALALREPVWPPEHLIDLRSPSLQLVVWAQLLVPKRLSSNDPFVPLPSRRNPSFAVLLAQHDRDTQGLPCLLSRSQFDNIANVPSSDGNTHCATISCTLHKLACIRIP